MKRFFKTFVVAMMAMGVIALVGCKKDEESNQEKQPVITSLASTSWEGSMSATIPLGGQTLPVTVVSQLYFKDAQVAELNLSVEGMPGMNMQNVANYTWNGDNQGVLHFEKGDVNMAANDSKHLTVNMTSAVVDDFTGTAEMIFTMLGNTIPFTYTKVDSI